MSSENGPTPPSERIVALDALRGFALLGILVINIRLFSMPEIVLSNPTAYGDFTGPNYWAWFVGHVLAEQKFITLFTILFGGGLLLFTRNAEKKGKEPLTLFFKRSGWLVAFGLVHAYALWYGDILVAYGVTAFFVVFLRDHDVRSLLGIAVVLLAIPSLTEVSVALTSEASQLASSLDPAASVLQSEIETYQSGWVEQLDHRVSTSFRRQTQGYLGYTFWRVAGAMVLGMALFKQGILTNERSSTFYRRLMLAGGVAGLSLTLAGVAFIEANEWAIDSILYWQQFNYWGSFLLAGGYIGAIMLFSRRFADGVVTKGLAAVGRTAFSNYILQTVVATTIFYGHGLGQFGQVTRVEALSLVVIIWLVQIPLSVLWLRYFRFGPMEWLWRLVTYESVPPLRR
ncbi:uncharacterized protein SAMN05216226_10666 [Halovenus aranensis]|uniref:DUF418 domain-containing protein n=1 Tax=Halovenus aranensis TaxID=890420 RepID=A0A1G8V982_9EURY|nr:DUF418 domain-containing protein [Halovenus aranensis]SDJ62417.1 uncharacterized protein SAMN05216226_10666 [Halovenus aranensis]